MTPRAPETVQKTNVGTDARSWSGERMTRDPKNFFTHTFFFSQVNVNTWTDLVDHVAIVEQTSDFQFLGVVWIDSISGLLEGGPVVVVVTDEQTAENFHFKKKKLITEKKKTYTSSSTIATDVTHAALLSLAT